MSVRVRVNTSKLRERVIESARVEEPLRRELYYHPRSLQLHLEEVLLYGVTLCVEVHGSRGDSEEGGYTPVSVRQLGFCSVGASARYPVQVVVFILVQEHKVECSFFRGQELYVF